MSAYATPLAPCRGGCEVWTHTASGYCRACLLPPVEPSKAAGDDGGARVPGDWRLPLIEAVRRTRHPIPSPRARSVR